MDFAKALTYPFEDEEWLPKLGIAAAISAAGVLLSFLVLPPIAAYILLLGWQVDIMKNVRAGVANPMPGWDDFGGMFQKGLTPFLALLVYQIPTILFACAATAVYVLPLLAGDNADAMAALGGLATVISICCSCLIFIYVIAAYMAWFGGLVRYLDAPEFSTFMAFSDNINLVRENIGDFGMAVLYLIGFGFLVGMASGLLSFLLVGIVVALVQQAAFAYFSGHIFGQLAAKLRGAPAV